ncbi:MAG: hypothetical protein JWN44_4031 [Myxococcales bacterium]|nr:hypothetical protein [Myxococcales bacterium]
MRTLKWLIPFAWVMGIGAQAGAEPSAPPAQSAGKPGAGATLPPAPSELRGTSVEKTADGFEQAPKNRLVLQNLFVVRLNPVGIEDQIRFGWQQRISDKMSPLFRDTFWFAGIAPKINPAFVKLGPSLELQPLSVFNLRLAAEYVGWFSTFGYLQSFGSPLDEYFERSLKQAQDANRNYATNGVHVMIEPLLQAKIGPIAIRNKLSLEYWYMSVHSGDTVFYDATLDTLVPANGWVLANDLDVLYINAKYRFVAGVRYSVVKPLFAQSDFRAGEDRSKDDNDHQRIGPLLAYTFFDHPGFGRFNKPTVLLIANWYLDHRYRTGREDIALLPSLYARGGGIPYIVLGFAFQSDLLPQKH